METIGGWTQPSMKPGSLKISKVPEFSLKKSFNIISLLLGTWGTTWERCPLRPLREGKAFFRADTSLEATKCTRRETLPMRRQPGVPWGEYPQSYTGNKIVLKIHGLATEHLGIAKQEEDGAGALSRFPFGMESALLGTVGVQGFCCQRPSWAGRFWNPSLPRQQQPWRILLDGAA